MATEPRITDFTNRDFASLVESLLDLASLRLPEWTDQSENDIGRMLLELFAYTGDVLLYYQDRIANEAFLETAVERRSVIDLLSLIGYTLATPAPASVALEVTPKDPGVTVQIDVGARFATEAAADKAPVEFVFLPTSGAPLVQRADVVGGKVLPIIVTAVNATRVDSETLGISLGLENQRLPLSQRPVILPRDPDPQDAISVEVDSGSGFERWQRRAALFYSLSDDTHFVTRVDDDDRAEINFGDGTFGRIPPAGAVIRASYLVGGGAQGNVAANTVKVVRSGVNTDVVVTNPKPASGGAERESIEDARRNAPGVFRSLQRAVTSDDIAALAETFPGVARAVAVPAAWNFVDVIVVADGALDLTDVLRASLVQYFESRRMVTTLITIREPVFVTISVEVVVGVEPTFFADDVARRGREALEALFTIDQLDFGKTFHLSKVFEAVEAVDGVAFVEVPGFIGRRSDPPGEIVDPQAAGAGRIPLRPREFPRLGTISLTTSGGLT
jgi:Baseplate J-like protein